LAAAVKQAGGPLLLNRTIKQAAGYGDGSYLAAALRARALTSPGQAVADAVRSSARTSPGQAVADALKATTYGDGSYLAEVLKAPPATPAPTVKPLPRVVKRPPSKAALQAQRVQHEAWVALTKMPVQWQTICALLEQLADCEERAERDRQAAAEREQHYRGVTEARERHGEKRERAMFRLTLPAVGITAMPWVANAAGLAGRLVF
jgi:hypothetical protein